MSGGSPTVLASFSGSNGEYPLRRFDTQRQHPVRHDPERRSYGYGTVFSDPCERRRPDGARLVQLRQRRRSLGRLDAQRQHPVRHDHTAAVCLRHGLQRPPERWQPHGARLVQRHQRQEPGGLTLSGNTLYGTTEFGGAYGYGTVFALTVPEPSTITLFSPLPPAWWATLGDGENATRKAGDPIESAKPASHPSSRAILKFLFPLTGPPQSRQRAQATTVRDRITSGSACVW